MKTVELKEMPSRKFIGETLFIDLTEHKTFRNQSVGRLKMTPKHRLYNKDNSNIGGWVGIDVELDEDVWIDKDTVVTGKSVIYGAVEITHGSRISNCSIIGNGLIRGAKISKSEIRGNFNIGHGTEIKDATIEGVAILDMMAIEMHIRRITLDNCKVNGRLIVEGKPNFYLKNCTVSGGLVVFRNSQIQKISSFSGVNCEFLGDVVVDLPDRDIRLSLFECFVNNSVLGHQSKSWHSDNKILAKCEINNVEFYEF